MRDIVRNIFLNIAGFVSNPKPGIHILNSHYVTPELVNEENKKTFETFIVNLIDKCRLITIQEAIHLIINKKFPKKESLIALTFDDGFEECYTIIGPLLEKYNCNAAFFINANFIESIEGTQNKITDRINVYTKRPMTWNQILDLHNRGHIIGSHTLDHVNMEELYPEEVDYQLIENKRMLEEKLQYDCQYFAWPYGQMQHFPFSALQKTLKYHKYIFSGTDYKHYFSYGGRVINRRHIEPFWPRNHTKYFLSKNKKI
jgi:peptidoglycan/xylan/chitin deacetylase (PgdA/CDA1 family)